MKHLLFNFKFTVYIYKFTYHLCQNNKISYFIKFVNV